MLLFQALDTFNTAVISPVYYVMFTTLTIFASMIMFKVIVYVLAARYCFWKKEFQVDIHISYNNQFDLMVLIQEWDSQNASQIATELCGFVTILSGTFLLHKTKDMGNENDDGESNSSPNEQRRV